MSALTDIERTYRVVGIDIDTLPEIEEDSEFLESTTGTFRLSDSHESHRLDWLEEHKAVAKSEDAEVRAAIEALDARKKELRRKGLI